MAIDRVLWFFGNNPYTNFNFGVYQDCVALIRLTNFPENLAFLSLIIVLKKIGVNAKKNYPSILLNFFLLHFPQRICKFLTEFAPPLLKGIT